MTQEDSWLSVQAVEAWWASPNQSAIKRPYPASAVAAIRDIYPENSRSNAMGLKLRRILDKHQAAKSINITTSPMDLMSQKMMADVGMETVYVSGGVASLTAVEDPGTDYADYTYDTLPRKVHLLHRAQLLTARVARNSDPEKAEAALMPLIADGDSGFGLYTTVMKLTKLFVQAGVAGFHIDDLLPGSKRYDKKDDEGWVIVPTSELLKRLSAARLQLDAMGSEVVLIYRADPHNATRITSSVDARDRAHILGATVRQPREYASLLTSPERAQWKKDAKLATIDEAFKAAHPELFEEFSQRSAGFNVSEAMEVARELAPNFYFSAEAARTSAGWYVFRGTMKASIERSLLAAKLAEMVWPNSTSYNFSEAEKYAKAILAVYPDKWLGYNVTGAFPADGSMDAEVKQLPSKIASLGYCWQFMPVAMFTASSVMAKRTAQGLMEGGVLNYLENVARPAAKEAGQDTERWMRLPAALCNIAADAIGDCIDDGAHV